MKIQGQFVDIKAKHIFPAEMTIEDGKISRIEKIESAPHQYIIPGFIDAHIHIESSMLVPSEFAKLAVIHGTVATISDPHEIANVLGRKGVYYMIDNANQTPLKFHFGAPSCVPATAFETAGAVINSEDIKELMASPDIYYLAEMMNYPGVLNGDEEVLKKIEYAKQSGKPLDGHAPGLRGNDAKRYIDAGMNTDHECFRFEEAKEKLTYGMKVIVREGSAAKNFNTLVDLIPEHFENMMFCSDDKHPDDLMVGHINELCARAVAKGMDVFQVLQMACINPAEHYKMKVGTLKINDPADFLLVEDLENFKVLKTYIDGNLVAEDGETFLETVPFEKPNVFNVTKKSAQDFRVNGDAEKIRVIEVLDGELITNETEANALIENGNIISDLDSDVLKMTVVNRYHDAKPAVAFIKNFGLKRGAIAGSVGHDSHNIIAVGTSDEEIANAVNLIIENKGGICAVHENEKKCLPLPVAGIMSDKNGWEVGKRYIEIDQMAKALGSNLRAPFMSLSFMALLVIPDLKLSDLGLFSGKSFQFVDLSKD